MVTFKLSGDEKKLLRHLWKGISRVHVLKVGLYPQVVTLVGLDDSIVRLYAREEFIGERFEVFPLCVDTNAPTLPTDHVISYENLAMPTAIQTLRKSEWSLPSTDEEKMGLLGNPDNAYTVRR